MAWKAKKIKQGTFRKYKRENNATITTAPPATIQSDVPVDMNALMQQMANLAHICNAALNNKRILIDSGCYTTIIASAINMPADYVPLFVDSLVSVSQMTNFHDCCIVFLKDKALTICLTPTIINLLNQIKTIAVDNNLLLCTSTLTTHNLYAVDNTTIDNTSSPLVANSTYYQTAQFDTVAEVV